MYRCGVERTDVADSVERLLYIFLDAYILVGQYVRWHGIILPLAIKLRNPIDGPSWACCWGRSAPLW